MPPAVARAIRELASALDAGAADPVEVLHALDLVRRGTSDLPLIQAVADGSHAKAALITTDKSIRTRAHERAAFIATGCIGIVLRGEWNKASMMDRAQASVRWWETWVRTVAEVKPGSLWRCPWLSRPKPLKPFDR
jgi:PIN domain-containing protein